MNIRKNIIKYLTNKQEIYGFANYSQLEDGDVERSFQVLCKR